MTTQLSNTKARVAYRTFIVEENYLTHHRLVESRCFAAKRKALPSSNDGPNQKSKARFRSIT